ncbi:hypothetical protein D3C78_1882740 [compost metagenome]
MCAYSGTPLAWAAALAAARDTARMALAPRVALFSVPSSSIIAWSSAFCSTGSLPSSRSRIGPLTLATAFSTPLPR